MKLSLKLWAGALTILAAAWVFYLGWLIHTIDPKVDRAGFIAAIWTHVGYGMLLLVPFFLYLLLPGNRVKSGLQLQWAMRFFIFLFSLKMLTGILTVFTRGSDLKVFDWFAIPSPWERMDAAYEFMEHFHAWLKYPFILATLWALLALGKAIFTVGDTGKDPAFNP